jgi:hypothetical protein
MRIKLSFQNKYLELVFFYSYHYPDNNPDWIIIRHLIRKVSVLGGIIVPALAIFNIFKGSTVNFFRYNALTVSIQGVIQYYSEKFKT